MQPQTDSFTTDDGTRIHTVKWCDETTAPRGVIMLVHGLGEHIGRYAHVADYLVEAGYVVYGQDHRGHGNSGGERVHSDHPDHFLHDLEQHMARIRTNHPDDKLFVIGHSMGTLITLQYVLAHPNALTGVVLSGTATDVASDVAAPLRAVGNFLYNVVPTVPISPPLGVETLTNDPAMQQQWENDPLVWKGWTRASLGKYILDTGEQMQQRAAEITLPALIMHGADDSIAPPSGSRIIYERLSSDDKALHIWDGMQHEIFNEIEREKVLATLRDWLHQH